MKYKPTAEQLAARDEKRRQFRAIVKQVASMSDAQRVQLTSKVGAVLTCEGRTLSLKNTLILMLQRENVSMVGGFKQWIRQGRCVRKGEHGLSIWVPCGAKATDGSADGNLDAESVHFICGTVFDVTQTEVIGAEESADVVDGVTLNNGVAA